MSPKHLFSFAFQLFIEKNEIFSVIYLIQRIGVTKRLLYTEKLEPQQVAPS